MSRYYIASILLVAFVGLQCCQGIPARSSLCGKHFQKMQEDELKDFFEFNLKYILDFIRELVAQNGYERYANHYSQLLKGLGSDMMPKRKHLFLEKILRNNEISELLDLLNSVQVFNKFLEKALSQEPSEENHKEDDDASESEEQPFFLDFEGSDDDEYDAIHSFLAIV